MILIPKNKNKQSGWYFPLCSNKISKTVAFTESCKYNSGDQQSDLHKIFGIGVFHLFNSFKTTKNKKWWELHKWLSLRVGWRYNIEEDCFEITDYCYINGIGERNSNDNTIVKVKSGEIVLVIISITKNCLELIIKKDNNVINILKTCKTPRVMVFFLKLRAYVGSGFTPNKDIIINKEKII